MKINTLAIREKMAEAKLTTKETARRADMCSPMLSKIIARGTCNAATAGRIAEALSVPVSDILG